MGGQEDKPRADGSGHWDEYLDDLAATEQVDREQASTAASAAARRRLLGELDRGEA